MRYTELEKLLEKKLDHGKVEIAGQSVLGRFIYYVSFDLKSDKTVLIQASMHARENITCDLVCKLIQDFDKNFTFYQSKMCPNVIFVPMVNPDGVELCHVGLRSVKGQLKKRFLFSINGSKDFTLYKSNANGVDLNTNFDAKWGSGKDNRLLPSSQGYIGPSPMSEPEVQALASLTKRVKPFFTISYHCKGEVIYYQFYNKTENIKRDRRIAKMVSFITGYRLKNVSASSSGGYKDWCVQRLNIPAVTIEVGPDKYDHPLPKSALKQIYRRNKNIIKILPKIKREYENDQRRKIHEYGLKRG